MIYGGRKPIIFSDFQVSLSQTCVLHDGEATAELSGFSTIKQKVRRAASVCRYTTDH